MRRYETIAILDPDLSEEGRTPVFERLTKLIPEQNGFLVKPENSKELSEAILYMISNENEVERNEMAKRAKEGIDEALSAGKDTVEKENYKVIKINSMHDMIRKTENMYMNINKEVEK